MKKNPEDSQDLLEQLLAGVQVLEASLRQAEARAQKYALETETLQSGGHAMRIRLDELERDYASLRLQKGGFGIRTLALAVLGGLLGGLLLAWVYLIFRPAPSEETMFETYRRTHLFAFELQLSQGEWQRVLDQLDRDARDPAYAPISDEIIFARKLLGASGARSAVD
jgi:hypothetical protein